METDVIDVQLAHEAANQIDLRGHDEDARLAALDRYDILDTPPEETFDRITRLARRIFRTPIATVSLVDGHRQWFKSRQGLELSETSRDAAFCTVTVRQNTPLIVPDAALDPMFADNPLVTGDPRIRFYAGAPLTTPDGHALGALCVIDTVPRSFDEEDAATLMDLARIVIDELELRQLAAVDTLTGALSRRAFRDEARRALHLAARHRHDLSLAVIDLDHFKSVNDTHGHPAGDAVLARSAAAITRQLRASDAVGRIGGEEFAVVLPHADQREALEIAERLRQAIAAQTFSAGGQVFQVTASLGVATQPKGCDGDIDALLRDADAALYAAKFSGRNACAPARPLANAPAAHARRRVFKRGRILFNRRMSSRECTIRSLGDASAALDVVSALGLPSEFELSIEADRVVRPCRLVGAIGRSLEVEFA
ncbi:sensor domain-containing diguanylate cyclase [Hansschlegelia zhihuaiae]|uniref:Sensor domain-containing diguanylate cyclase n=1 Tax=Hansschlegelia zhihuaiae TaxID=405005 RepID=A0A4Q0MPC1_9HYPH|nr:sensor domain-containing diguanylate cyclase [Hansschlegelia zhihuaiae]RXF75604.1 sensor domain-containing diguanylate cyclase [Hansschlegelia zhihuaiae]